MKRMNLLKKVLANGAAAIGILSGSADPASAQGQNGNLAEFLGLKVGEVQTFGNKGTLTLIQQKCAEASPTYLVCDLNVVSVQTLQSADFSAEYRQDPNGQIQTSVRKVHDNDWSSFDGKQALKEINAANEAPYGWNAQSVLASTISSPSDGRVVQNDVRLLQAKSGDSLQISSLLPVNENFGFVITNAFNEKASGQTSFSITPLAVNAGVVSSAFAHRDMENADYDYASVRAKEALKEGGMAFRP